MDRLDPGPPAPPDPAVQAATLDWLPEPDWDDPGYRERERLWLRHCGDGWPQPHGK
jgi:hypothetical protein